MTWVAGGPKIIWSKSIFYGKDTQYLSSTVLIKDRRFQSIRKDEFEHEICYTSPLDYWRSKMRSFGENWDLWRIVSRAKVVSDMVKWLAWCRHDRLNLIYIYIFEWNYLNHVKAKRTQAMGIDKRLQLDIQNVDSVLYLCIVSSC